MPSNKTVRRALSKKTRFEVFKRDVYACQYCGAHPPNVILEIDHIVPVAGGGSNKIDNLITSCFNCNRGKGAIPLDKILPSMAEKSAKVAESELQLREYYKVLEAQESRLEGEMWAIAEIMSPKCIKDGFKSAWLTSIKTFLKRLDFYEVANSMEVAVCRKPQRTYTTFQYFCGICWSKIKGQNDA